MDKKIFKGIVWIKKEDVSNLINQVLLSRRHMINEGIKDERILAHLHTFVNKFEEELKLKMEINQDGME